MIDFGLKGKVVVTCKDRFSSYLEKELVDLKVELSRLREKFRSYPGYISEEEQVFSLEKLQANLPNHYGVLSLFKSKENLIVFWVDSGEFLWKLLPKKEIEWDLLLKWTEGIQFSNSASRYQTDRVVDLFSKQIFEPFAHQLDQVDELMVIPHGDFNSFPFELLPLSSGRLLLEEKAVSYQFSCRFIAPVWKTVDQTSLLAFAPFSGIAKDLNTSVAKVSMSLSSYFIGISAGQLLYGPLLDRFGRKKPLFIAFRRSLR